MTDSTLATGDGPSAASVRVGRRDRDAVAFAVDALRSRILTGEIPAGEELSQVALARMLGVSTTPLREALRQLEAEGLVQSQRNRRPRVAPFDPNDLENVYCGRILFESLAIALTVSEIGEPQLAVLRADLTEMKRCAKPSRRERWETVHAAFHVHLIEGCNPALREQVTILMGRSDRYRRMSILGSSPREWHVGEAEHEALVEACERRDSAGAALLLAKHLARSALIVAAHHMAPDVDLAGVRMALQLVTTGASGFGRAGRRVSM